MTELENAFQVLSTEAERIPFTQGVARLHDLFNQLSRAGFLLPRHRWLNAFELAAIAKLVYLKGHDRPPRPNDDLLHALNAYKLLWSVAEKEVSYTDNPEYITTFVLRFVYQQLPWKITPQRMEQNYLRTLELFGGTSAAAQSLRAVFEEKVGLTLADFLECAKALFAIFKNRASIPDHAVDSILRTRFGPTAILRTIGVISATRNQFKKYDDSLAPQSGKQTPYALNPLLRFPVLYRHDSYWCAYPALINYAATRGLYFYLLDALGPTFSQAFSDAFEDYLYLLWSRAVDAAHLITEKDERSLGWHGKTNDLTIILGESALLFECKNSGLFSLSKKSAQPEDLIADIKRNLANADRRKGLFQLYDKVQAIRNGALPHGLKERYSMVRILHPIILLYDEIWFANSPETLRNIIDGELRSSGIIDFDYQIWHIEELEFLLKSVPKAELGAVVAKKCTSPRFRTLDLSSYLSRRPGLEHLGLVLFTPNGESQAWQVLSRLAASEADNQAGE